MKSTSLRQGILAVGLLASMAVAARERSNLNDALDSASTLREERAHLELHRRALLMSLDGLEWFDPFLAAEVVIGQGFSATEPLRTPTDIILYLLSTGCPACALNFPVLNEMADRGIPVVGLARDSNVGDVQEYCDSTGPRFPLLVGAHGSALQGIPSYGTPTAVVFSGGKVAYIAFGQFTNATLSHLDAITEGWLRKPRDLETSQ